MGLCYSWFKRRNRVGLVSSQSSQPLVPDNNNRRHSGNEANQVDSPPKTDDIIEDIVDEEKYRIEEIEPNKTKHVTISELPNTNNQQKENKGAATIKENANSNHIVPNDTTETSTEKTDVQHKKAEEITTNSRTKPNGTNKTATTNKGIESPTHDIQEHRNTKAVTKRATPECQKSEARETNEQVSIYESRQKSCSTIGTTSTQTWSDSDESNTTGNDFSIDTSLDTNYDQQSKGSNVSNYATLSRAKLPTMDQEKYEMCVQEAAKKKGTILITNAGKVYRSSCKKGKNGERIHAEDKFIRNSRNCKITPSTITAIWIKNTPCTPCSSKLLDFYDNQQKPTMYIGRIYHPKEHEKGLLDLTDAGFKFTEWEDVLELRDKRESLHTRDYIKKLQNR